MSFFILIFVLFSSRIFILFFPYRFQSFIQKSLSFLLYSCICLFYLYLKVYFLAPMSLFPLAVFSLFLKYFILSLSITIIFNWMLWDDSKWGGAHPAVIVNLVLDVLVTNVCVTNKATIYTHSICFNNFFLTGFLAVDI